MTTAPLTAQSAIALAAAGKITLLDVRETAEVQASGKARGAHHIPLGLLPLKADPKAPDLDPALKTGNPIAIYCAAGGRAGRAVDLLHGLGYTDVHNIGGMQAWIDAGGPVER